MKKNTRRPRPPRIPLATQQRRKGGLIHQKQHMNFNLAYEIIKCRLTLGVSSNFHKTYS